MNKDVGIDDTIDSDIDTAQQTNINSVTSGNTTSNVDAGYHVLIGSIGDYVWEDADVDGFQDIEESGIPGVTVTLTGAGTDGDINTTGDNTTATTTTDATGYYQFDSVDPNDYQITFDISTNTADGGAAFTNYLVTTQDINTNTADTVDSDIDSTTEQSHVFTLTAGSSDMTVDAGYYRPATLEGIAWLEPLVGDNATSGDAGETLLTGVGVTIYHDDGTPVTL